MHAHNRLNFNMNQPMMAEPTFLRTVQSLLELKSKTMTTNNIMPIVRQTDKQQLVYDKNSLQDLLMNNNVYRPPARAQPRVTTTTNHYHFVQKGNDSKQAAITLTRTTSLSLEDYSLEPRAIWEGQDCQPTKVNNSNNPTKMNHPAKMNPPANEAPQHPFDNRDPQQVVDFLLQRNRTFLKGNKTDTMKQMHVESDYFLDGRELERNVVVDNETDRSYVYTTDLGARWMLPEFLFLDVPNSTYAARACGQFVTNKLILDLKRMVKPGSNKISSLDLLIKNCNKSDYEVQNIFVPKEHVQQKHHQSVADKNTPVQAITARFRLRYARTGTNVHKMLCHNFMNSQQCARGILVFIPCMEQNSPAQRFWGSLQGVDPLPTVEEDITNAKMDKYCFQVAQRHGTYRGSYPQLMGRSVVEHNDSFANRNRSALTAPKKATTKKVAPAKKGASKILKKRSMSTKKGSRKILGQPGVAVKTEMG